MMNQRGDEKRAVSLHIALSKKREKEHFVFVALEILPWCGEYQTVEFGLCGSTTDFVCWSIVIVLFHPVACRIRAVLPGACAH